MELRLLAKLEVLARTLGIFFASKWTVTAAMHRNIILGMLFNLAGACRGSLSLAFDAFVLLLPGGTNTQVWVD